MTKASQIILNITKASIPVVGLLACCVSFAQSGSVNLMGQMIAPFVHIDQIKLHADGRSLAILGESLVVDYDTTTFKQRWKSPIYPHTERLFGEGSFSIDPAGKTLIHGFMTNGGKDSCVRMVDLATGKNIFFSDIMPNNDGPYTTLALSDDNRLALSGAWIGQEGIKLWDMQTGSVIATVGKSLKSVAVDFSPQKQFAYEIHTDGISIFSLVNYQVVRRVSMHDLFGPRYQSCGPNDCGPRTREIIGAQFSSSMRYVAIHTSTDLYVIDDNDESEVFLVDLETGKVLWKVAFGVKNFPRLIMLDEVKNKISVISSESYLKSGPSLLTTYNLLTGKVIQQIAGPKVWSLAGTRTPMRPGAFLSYDSQSGLIASGSRSGHIEIYKMELE